MKQKKRNRGPERLVYHETKRWKSGQGKKGFKKRTFFGFQNMSEALPGKTCFSWNRGRAVLLTGPEGQKESAVFLVKHRARIQV